VRQQQKQNQASHERAWHARRCFDRMRVSKHRFRMVTRIQARWRAHCHHSPKNCIPFSRQVGRRPHLALQHGVWSWGV
jgi:hypothetical protein